MTSLLLFCITSKLSGGEIYSVQLLRALGKAGWTVSMVGPSTNVELQKRCVQHGIRFVPTDIGPKLGKKTALSLLFRWKANRRKLLSLIDKESPDVVLLQYKLEQMLWGGTPLGRSVVMLEHGPIPKAIRTIPILRHRYRRALTASDVRFAASRPGTEAIRALGSTSKILPAGVDQTKSRSAIAAAQETRRLLQGQLQECTKIGFYAGRLTADKGIVRAAEIIQGMPQVGLVIAGTGPEIHRLEEIASRAANILVLGQIDDPLRYAAGVDFGILLTNDPGEGRPLFALECVSVGTPVIAAAGSGAVGDLIAEVGHGPILPVEDSDNAAIATAIATAKRFNPIALDWDKAAVVFSESLKASIRPNAANMNSPIKNHGSPHA